MIVGVRRPQQKPYQRIMRQNREKVAKTPYLRKFKSDFDKITHDAYIYAN